MKKKCIPFIYMIESSSPDDIYDNRTELEVISSISKLTGSYFSHRRVYNREKFTHAIITDLFDNLTRFRSDIKDPNTEVVFPIYLHISAHGSRGKNGIFLTDGDLITWSDLDDILRPINTLLADSIILCISGCYGYNAVSMAKSFKDDNPFWFLISSENATTWDSFATAFVMFYKMMKNSINGTDPNMTSLKRMEKLINVVTGEKTAFKIVNAEEIKTDFKNRLENLVQLYGNLKPNQATLNSSIDKL